jgi:beta-phosphoglucomutase-like phosphatase (HAD superfamily)
MQDSKIKYVLFDFDGVLIDSEPIYYSIWEDLLKPYHIEFTLENLTGKTNEQFLAQFDIEDKVQIILEKHKIANNLIPKIEANIRFINLIEKLGKQKISMAIVSNNHSDVIHESLLNNKILGYLENNIYTPDLFIGLSPKPSGDLYLKAISKFNFHNNQILVIEDSEIGYKACKNANLNYIKFSHLLFDDSMSHIEKALLC